MSEGTKVVEGIAGVEFVRFDQLRSLGVPYSKTHVNRMEQHGRFPCKVKFGPQRAWYIKREVEAWCSDRIERNGLVDARGYRITESE